MECKRCNQPITPGQLYTEAMYYQIPPEWAEHFWNPSPFPVHVECPITSEKREQLVDALLDACGHPDFDYGEQRRRIGTFVDLLTGGKP